MVVSVGAVGSVGMVGAPQESVAVSPASGAASAGDQGSKGGSVSPVNGGEKGSDATPAWPKDYAQGCRSMSTADFVTLSQQASAVKEEQGLIDPEALKKMMMVKLIMEILKALTDDNGAGGNNLGIA